MKQVLQSLNSGETAVEEIPCPLNKAKSLLIETKKTLVSAGTERMLLEFGKASIFGKIKQQPDKVKMVIQKIKTDGLSTTLQAVKDKLDQPLPLGYCNVGVAREVGAEVSGYQVGDRVISNGSHAEMVRVPQNLCAKIPDAVSDEEATFTVIASIALQSVRLSNPTLGECYVVMGLGLVGLMTVQLLLANGCRVLGVDFDKTKCCLAEQFGAEVVNLSRSQHLLSRAEQFARGRGVDGVIIAASTKSSEPLSQAAQMCRKRGRIVLVGVIGGEYSRADFYEKELTFQVSCSYGPGRYDEAYEQQGQDYPVGFVRWTEQRNFEAVLDMMALGRLKVGPLITHQFDIENAEAAYAVLESDKAALGILLNYPSTDIAKKTQTSVYLEHAAGKLNDKTVSVGFIGAGNYASRVLAPAFKQANVKLMTVASSQGISGKLVAKKIGFHQAVTDENLIYNNSDLDVIVIATRHNLHAKQVVKALNSGKHVFVEKPLALTLGELDAIKQAYELSDRLLMVGFNRRFAPHVQTMKLLLEAESAPKSFIMTVNAGFIPEDHWTQNSAIGGGRLVGEACHFIDLLRYLSGSQIQSWNAISVDTSTGINDDNAMIGLTFEDGSCGTIHYLANGHKAVSKERLEVFCDGKILQLDNFRKLVGHGFRRFKKQKLRKQDKGQVNCVRAFADAVSLGAVSPIPFDELFEVSKVAVEVAEYMRRKT